MEVNSTHIKSLRNARGWTQSHLSEACGVSLRTIQRVEKFGNASNETVMSLCAVFEIEQQQLSVIPQQQKEDMTTVSVTSNYITLVAALLVGSLLGAFAMYWVMQ